jgi:hypothetical protein
LSSIIESGGNQADNEASFQKTVLSINMPSGAAGAPAVQIDYVDSILDLHSVLQTNSLADNDVIVQTTSSRYTGVVSGDNGQANYSLTQDWGKQYDVLVVGGEYHAANIIIQTNVVIDNDVVLSTLTGAGAGPSAAAGGGAAVAQSLYAGQNQLLNTASIHAYDTDTIGDYDLSIDDLVTKLLNKEAIDPSAWSQFPGAADGSLSVLVVKNDYYNVNLISQQNIISDVDTAVQFMTASSFNMPAAHGSTQAGKASPPSNGSVTPVEIGLEDHYTPPSQQSPGASSASNPSPSDQATTPTHAVTTGGNQSLNVAQIVDVGAIADRYVGGGYYEDSLLIQGNLLSSQDHHVVDNVHSFVNEVVVFAAEQIEEATSHPSSPVHQDFFDNLLGGLMN